MKGPLAVLLDLAQRQCDDAAKALAAQAAAREECRRRGALLERYRGEYVARLEGAARGGIDGGWLRNMRRFLDRIDEAQRQQRLDNETSARRFDEARAAWQAAQRRREAYAALDHRRVAVEALGERRAEQRAQDEAAARSTRPQGG
jgi:flagellar FliJ protein